MEMILKDKIKALSAAYFEKYRQTRHHLHAHPELSYQEYNTSSYIQSKLKEIGIPFTVMAGTGVVGIIKGKSSERVIALRTTCLLGAAEILNELKDEWEGTIKLIFQPGEEKNPGGASIMIKEGVLKDPSPDAIYGLHVHPTLETGKISFRAGKVMASADELYITIKGKGGHAASPHLTTDTILTASQLVVALQQVVSRNNDPFSPSVLSICSFQGGHTTNVIPSEVNLKGTFRAMDETWRFEAHKRITEIVDHIAKANRATIDLKIDIGYPTVYNDPALHEHATKLGESYLGSENVNETELRMGAEDFGYYSQKIPGCFFRLGTGNIQKGIVSGVHTPTFDIDEKAIEIGMGMMAFIGVSK